MAEDIVACPGCGKKFRIPEGAPGGTFQCTACNASVPYGKAAAKPAAGKPVAARGAAPVSRAAPASAHAAPHAAPHTRHHHHAKGHHAAGRHAHEDAGDEEMPRHGAKKGQDQTLIWVSVGGIALAVVGFFVWMQSNKTPVVEPPTVAPPPATTVVGPPPVAPPVEPATTAPTGTDPAAAGTATAGGTPGPSGIGGTGTKSGTGGAAAPSNPDALFVRMADIPGVTEQERAAMDKDVGLLIDRDTAAAGVAAGRRLGKLGRKAVPPLLSVFESHWKGKKWDDDREKIAAHEVQTLLIQIVKADRPGSDFIARYDPRSPVPQKDFQKAATIWVKWWLEKGKDIEKFTDFPE